VEAYKHKDIKKMAREEKVKRYEWRVKFLPGVIEFWRNQMSEPEEYGTFDDWKVCDNNSDGLTELIDEMISLACEIDPQAVKTLREMKGGIINIRISNYQIAKWIDGLCSPSLTPEEEAAAEIEKAEAYHTGGASLLLKQAVQGGTGDV